MSITFQTTTSKSSIRAGKAATEDWLECSQGELTVIVSDLLQKTDAELVKMLEKIGNEPVDWTPVVLSELTRRSVVRLGETSERIAVSSRRLEKLTAWLIVLTIIVGIVALPPAIEVLSKLLG